MSREQHEHHNVKSAGHIAFVGDGEFFEVDGEVYVAPRYRPLANLRRGTRHGRWECSRVHFERYRSIYLPEERVPCGCEERLGYQCTECDDNGMVPRGES